MDYNRNGLYRCDYCFRKLEDLRGGVVMVPKGIYGGGEGCGGTDEIEIT